MPFRQPERRYFGVTNPAFNFYQVWFVEGLFAARSMPDRPSQLSHVDLQTGDDFEPKVISLLSGDYGPNGWRIVPMLLPPGAYYPRMARPTDLRPLDAPGYCPGFQKYEHELALMHGQMASLMRHLERVCRVVHPVPQTLSTYGQEIRNLLILACAEVEANWRAVLRENGVTKERLNTKDYVQLQQAMRLGDYAISFPHFPWLEPFRPFAGWGSTGAPTQELAWYDAYNGVKHDREENFASGTLAHAFSAIAACAVMHAAQMGQKNAFRRGAGLDGFVRIEAAPVWPYEEVYVWNYSSSDDMMMIYGGAEPTGTSSTPIPYPFQIT